MPAVWSASSQQMLAFISGNVKKKPIKSLLVYLKISCLNIRPDLGRGMSLFY